MIADYSNTSRVTLTLEPSDIIDGEINRRILEVAINAVTDRETIFNLDLLVHTGIAAVSKATIDDLGFKIAGTVDSDLLLRKPIRRSHD